MSYEEIRALMGTIGLIIFMLLFVGVLVYTFRPGSQKEMDENANIPLNEDKEHE